MDTPNRKSKFTRQRMSKPDLDKVYNNLMAIVSKGFENTMFEAGKYLIKTFYGGELQSCTEGQEKTISQFAESIHPRICENIIQEPPENHGFTMLSIW